MVLRRSVSQMRTPDDERFRVHLEKENTPGNLHLKVSNPKYPGGMTPKESRTSVKKGSTRKTETGIKRKEPAAVLRQPAKKAKRNANEEDKTATSAEAGNIEDKQEHVDLFDEYTNWEEFEAKAEKEKKRIVDIVTIALGKFLRPEIEAIRKWANQDEIMPPLQMSDGTFGMNNYNHPVAKLLGIIPGELSLTGYSEQNLKTILQQLQHDEKIWGTIEKAREVGRV
ncbi:hypothetical protein B0I35DRAFT_501191 [Stachybotrys elegans]|uniref:Uncharacterized protein n=1 Tax=Stachybotrys elegans TaxID=80388 RepID=A0A8K0WTD0_9HYPO|nr:hypothetical protein B0I35DRAFT_501191 [Stachybotrys elegans]